MDNDDAAGAGKDPPDDDSLSCKSGIVRIGVKSATGKKEDKVVRLSINIPNFKRNISVEVPLQKILEDDVDDDDCDDVINEKSRALSDSSEGATCSRCQLAKRDESKRIIASEMKTSLRQLLLSKLLERLAKKTLFRNYEKLLFSEAEECSEMDTRSSITYQASEVPGKSSTETPNRRQFDLPDPKLEAGDVDREAAGTHYKAENPVSNNSTLEQIGDQISSLPGNIPLDELPKDASRRHSKHFVDVSTETKQAAAKVDKSTTIHKDESTQTGIPSELPLESLDYRSYLENKHRSKQPSSVSSSCQTDVEESFPLYHPFNRVRSEDLKVESISRHDVIPGLVSTTDSSQNRFEKTNGELEESEREENRTPQPLDSFRKSSFHHDDSATETESVSSSLRSSVSSTALHSRTDKFDHKSVMTFGKEVAQISQKTFNNPETTKVIASNLESKKNYDPVNKHPKVGNHLNTSKDAKSSVTDNYLKNLKGRPTSTEQVAGKETVEDCGIRRFSKDKGTFPSSTTKTEQLPPLNSTESTTQQQKQASKGRSFSLKPSELGTKRLFDFGVDYTKTKQPGASPVSDSNSSTSSQSQKTQSTFSTSPDPSKRQSSKSNAEVRKSPLNEGQPPKVDMGGNRPPSGDAASTTSKSHGNEQNSSNKSLSVQSPEHKERGRLPSSFRNLVSAFETKTNNSEDFPGVNPAYKS